MYNKSQLIGRMGRDPEIRLTQDQKAVASLSVVTTDYWKDKSSGERKERAEWHRVILFGHLAEIARDHLHKGALVLLEGPIRTRKWQDKQSNQERYTTEIHADNMKMLGGKTNNAADSTSQAASPQSNNIPPAYDGPSYDDLDDIPF